MDYGIIAAILSAVLSVAGVFLGAKYAKLKALGNKVVAAFEDDNVTTEEFEAIMKDLKALLTGE